MKFKAMIAAIALAFAAPAFAQITTIALAHEVSLNDVRFPQSTSGTIGYRPCAECEYTTKRVSGDTRWMLNGQAVTLDRFRAGLAHITNRNTEVVTITHHLEEDRVTEVSVYLR